MGAGVTGLADPAFWAAPDAYAVVGAMRRRDPVVRHDTADDGPVWSVLGHPEAVAVLGDPATYSSRGGSLLLGTGWSEAPAGADTMMALSDPPAHRRTRAPAVPFFSTAGVDGLASRVRALTGEVVRRAVEKGDVDFVADVAAVVPLVVMCDLVGVPPADRAEVVAWCEAAFLLGSSAARREAHQRLLSYLLRLAIQRRRSPAGDLCSAFAADAAGIGLEGAVLACENLLVGGVQSVRHTASCAVDTLLERPDLYERLASGGHGLRPAVEELLRWTSVALHVMRTATRDTELGGHAIRAGDRVVVWAPAANRDERVFTGPELLDLDRDPNRHLALGWGVHYCIGAGLARLELRALFAELLARAGALERLGPARPVVSIINLGLEALPMRLHARHDVPAVRP